MSNNNKVLIKCNCLLDLAQPKECNRFKILNEIIKNEPTSKSIPP